MAEAIEKTADEILLEDVLNEIDVTFDDKRTRKRIKEIMQQGKERLEQLKGAAIDFEKEKTARTLLFSFCRYGRSNAIEEFERDFSQQLTAFTLEAVITNMLESEREMEDENEV